MKFCVNLRDLRDIKEKIKFYLPTDFTDLHRFLDIKKALLAAVL